jgi:hypothetical protein
MSRGWTAADVAAREGLTVETPKPSKYRSVKKEVDGILFDSGKEARAYVGLSAMCKAHGWNLDRQVAFVLQEKLPRRYFEEYACGCVSEYEDRRKELCGYCGKHGDDRRHAHSLPAMRAIKIVVDFVVTDCSGKRIVYEVKTRITKTAAYRIKRKLFMAKYPGIEFHEWE